MTAICLSGLGKTGKEIAKFLLEQDHLNVVAAICSPNSSKKGQDLGQVIGVSNTGVIMECADDLEQVIFRTRPDVVVDFSNPKAVLKNAKIFSKLKVNMVIGTTGFTDTELQKLYLLSKKYRNGIVYAPNITLGVNVLMVLSHLAATILNNYDFQVTDVHHKYKKDAPSGTAIKIAAGIEEGLRTSNPAAKNIQVPINAVRAGGVIGKHEVSIFGEEDSIIISHESFSRKAFAVGALKAIEFIKDKVGYYEMKDVLNLREILNAYLEKEIALNNERQMDFMDYMQFEDTKAQ